MIVTFRQTTGEFIYAYNYINKKLYSRTKWSSLYTLNSIVFWILLLVGIAFISGHYVDYGSTGVGELNKGFFIIAAAVIIFLIGSHMISKKVRSFIFDPNGLYLSQQTFKIEAEYLYQEMGENQYFYNWKYVKEIEKTNAYIFIFLDNAVALYIPLHAFENESQYESFYNMLKNQKQVYATL